MHPNQNQSATNTIYPFEKSAPISAPLELTADLRYILGLPHAKLAITVQKLRLIGHCIGERSEDEQASVIHWMLGHYLRHGIHWRVFAYCEININDDFPGFPGDESVCSCDGCKTAQETSNA